MAMQWYMYCYYSIMQVPSNFFIMKLYEILSKLRVVHSVYRKGKNFGLPWQPHVRLFIFSQNNLVVLLALCSCTCQSLHRLNIPTTYDQICMIAAVK